MKAALQNPPPEVTALVDALSAVMDEGGSYDRISDITLNLVSKALAAYEQARKV